MGKDEILRVKVNRRKELKKYNKRLKLDPTFLKKLPYEIQKDMSLLKYWHNRFRLFKKFDHGIKLDKGKINYNISFVCYIYYHKFIKEIEFQH